MQQHASSNRKLLSRRQFLQAAAAASAVAALAACVAPAAMPAPSGGDAAATPVASEGRPDWVTAAKPYAGATLTGLVADTSWGNGAIEQAAKFSELTGIKIEFEKIPQDNYNQKLQAEAFGQTGAYDFFAIADVITDFAKAGVLLDLQPFVDDPAFPDYNLTDYSQNTLDFLSLRDGKLVTLPNELAGMVMYYRKDLFAEAGVEPPTTWQETYEVAKKLRKGDVYGAIIEMKGGAAAWRFTNALPPGTQWLDKEMRLSALTDPRTVETIGLWRKMYVEDIIPKSVLETDYGTIIEAYRTGKTAMLPCFWPSEVTNTEDPAKSQVAGKNGYAPVPGAAPFAAGWGWSVSTDSDAKEAAYLFISWLTNQEQSEEALVKYGIDRGRQSVINERTKEAIMARPNGSAQWEPIEALSKSWANAKTSPTIPEWSQVWDVIALHVQKIVAGEEEAQPGLEAARSESEKILEDAGYYKQ